MVYNGAPSQHLRPVSLTMREKLASGHRCIYLNSLPMVAGIQSYLAAAGVDVQHELTKGSLILTSERLHLVDGKFRPDLMLNMLTAEVERALRDGYEGLWATGDMTWEMGTDQDLAKLLEYERQLEAVFQIYPCLGGVCQYHADTLPREVLRGALDSHRALYVSETLSVVNPSYRAVAG